MIRGTTPEYIITIPDFDVSNYSVYVTVAQPNRKVTKTSSQLDIKVEEYIDDDSNTGILSTIAFMLTQEETLLFHVGEAKVQVRFVDQNGMALATEEGVLTVEPVLLEKVIGYGTGN